MMNQSPVTSPQTEDWQLATISGSFFVLSIQKTRKTMKTLGFKAILGVVALLSGVVAGFGQASQPEVPGDNFSLEGALELFKKSSSPEEFEKMLNTPDTKVNNLDLNGDGYIDY